MNDKILIHHGVKGQRWGVRRFQNEDGTRTALGKKHEKTLGSYDESNGKSNAKQEYKQAKKAYNKSFNEYYNKSLAAFSPVKKHREANIQRLDKAIQDAEKLKQAKTQYKAEKKEAHAEAKAAAKDIRKNMKTGEKVAAFMVGGPFGAQAVSNYMSAGYSKGAAYAKTFLEGSASLPISTVTRNVASEKKKFN